jgi:hypothetical protein
MMTAVAAVRSLQLAGPCLLGALGSEPLGGWEARTQDREGDERDAELVIADSAMTQRHIYR